ncbi:putative ankyrin 2,3/unc44 [Operophtera brumata]|uniref:Putative ankyrin 2,3/unc44 n=1 Tax=Operophtera brumata TaxID=104452 RepID=A0A0L7K4S2_OPEBR|nr:putative ankyrin 2,3/unc44 [Operophtera brumata]
MFPTGAPQEHLPFMLNSVSCLITIDKHTSLYNTFKKKGSSAPKDVVKRVKKFVRKPLTFTWKTGKFKHVGTVELPQYHSPFDTDLKSPLDYFYTLFSEDIIDLIMDNTNLYSVQSGAARCINGTTTSLMGVVLMPAYRDNLSNVSRYPLITDVMTLKK